MFIYSCEELHCIISCQGSGILLHTLYLIYQLLIGLKQLLIGLWILTWPSPLTRNQDTNVFSRLLAGSISLTRFFFLVDHLVGIIPTRVFPWPGFLQLTTQPFIPNTMCYIDHTTETIFPMHCFSIIFYKSSVSSVCYQLRFCILDHMSNICCSIFC